MSYSGPIHAASGSTPSLSARNLGEKATFVSMRDDRHLGQTVTNESAESAAGPALRMASHLQASDT